MADPYSKQEIDELRSPALAWQYLDARRIVATWDALLAEKQAAIEKLLWLSDGWVGREETRNKMRRLAQHDGQALRERDTEMIENIVRACVSELTDFPPRSVGADFVAGRCITAYQEAHPNHYRQPQADHIPAAFKQPTPPKPRRLTDDEVRQIAEAEVGYQADHPTTTTTDEEIQQAADDEYFIGEAARMTTTDEEG